MEPSSSQHKEFVESEVAWVTVSKGRHIFASKIIFLTCFFFCVFPFSVPADTTRGKPSSGKGPQQTGEKLLAFDTAGSGCSQRYDLLRGGFLVCKHPVAAQIDAQIYSEAVVHAYGRSQNKDHLGL